jgi:hypothetical protein
MFLDHQNCSHDDGSQVLKLLPACDIRDTVASMTSRCQFSDCAINADCSVALRYRICSRFPDCSHTFTTRTTVDPVTGCHVVFDEQHNHFDYSDRTTRCCTDVVAQFGL